MSAKALSPPPPPPMPERTYEQKCKFVFFMYISIMFLKRERPETDDFVIKKIYGWEEKILSRNLIISINY